MGANDAGDHLMSEEAFNLDRKVNVAENIDPTGKKWEIKKVNKTGALYVAVPNPYHADFVCPKSFQGAWTQPSVLQEKISIWLNLQWDKAEKAQQRAGIVATQAKLAAKEAETKQTPEESMAALDPEIKAELEDVINAKSPEESKAEEAEVGRETETDNNKEEDQAKASEEVAPVVKKKVAKKGK